MAASEVCHAGHAGLDRARLAQVAGRSGPLSLAGPAISQRSGALPQLPFADGRPEWQRQSQPQDLYWTGYMDGAVRSAERVATEVGNALRRK